MSNQRTGKAVRDSLMNLPANLQETYAKMLEKILPDDRKYVRRALLWLSFAVRPLSLAELNEAVVLDESDTTLVEDDQLFPPQIILNLCQGLIDSDMGKLTLSHSSVKDFLTSNWITTSKVRDFRLDYLDGNRTIMRKCLTYLCFDDFKYGYSILKTQIDGRFEKYPLLSYAAHFWAIHGNICSFDAPDREIVNRFFATKKLLHGGNFGVWVQCLIPRAGQYDIERTEPLYYAASFGLVPVIKAIIESDPHLNIDAEGGRVGSTPLFVAGWRKNYDVVELLLQAGADPELLDYSTGYDLISFAKAYGDYRLLELIDKYRKVK